MDDAYRKLRKSRKLNDIILQSLFLPIIEVFPILSAVIFSLNQILTLFYAIPLKTLVNPSYLFDLCGIVQCYISFYVHYLSPFSFLYSFYVVLCNTDKVFFSIKQLHILTNLP